VVVVPDPIRVCDHADPVAKVELGPCGADSLKLCVYTVAMAEVDCWTGSCSGLAGGWNSVEFPPGLSLGPGTYYLSVTAAKNAQTAHATAAFVVLP
jgi:hypothetical protein